MYELLLAIHIAGACITGLAASYAGIAMWQRQENTYRPLALILGVLAGFEILTGTALSVVSSQITAISLCGNIAIYLSVVFAVEALLYTRMKKISLTFPLAYVATTVASALSLLAGAAALGF
ncbi:hypothetical protein HY968_04520 [Candidatus Kaiserbacteria bacterium]|nr:hypothetical protein [Candidatus Kaiserbacteria bacterium]